MLYQDKPYDTLFLDRDGVLNRKIEHGYVLQEADIEILPGIKEFLAWAKKKFNHIVVVTNQRCVGRQIITLNQIEFINNRINKLTGSFIDAFYVCPHLDEDACTCRKPKTGLFLKASENFPVDFQNSWMIGDSVTDLIPARELQIKTIYISTEGSPLADKTIPSTKELLDFEVLVTNG